jgi:hypothetical protein
LIDRPAQEFFVLFPAQEFFTCMETSPLQMKGSKIGAFKQGRI